MPLHRPHPPDRSATIGLLPPGYQPSPLPGQHLATGECPPPGNGWARRNSLVFGYVVKGTVAWRGVNRQFPCFDCAAETGSGYPHFDSRLRTSADPGAVDVTGPRVAFRSSRGQDGAAASREAHQDRKDSPHAHD